MIKILQILKLTIGLSTLSTAAFAYERMPANMPMMTGAESDNVRQFMPAAHQEAPSHYNDGRNYPRLWMGSVRWEQPIETAVYMVDGAIQPLVDLRYTFQLTPQLRTPENRVKEMDSGYYVLRMIVLRPLLSHEEDDIRSDKLSVRYVAGTERLVQLAQGSIKTTVNLRFHNLSATAMRNTLLIQLLPVKTNSLKRDRNGLISSNSSYELVSAPNYLSNVIRLPFIPRQASGLSTPPNAVTSDDVNEEEEKLDLGVFMRSAENVMALNQQILRRYKPPSIIAEQMHLDYMRVDEGRMDSLLKPFPENRSVGDKTKSRYNWKVLNSAQLAGQLNDLSQNRPYLSENIAPTICRLLINNFEVENNVVGPKAKSIGMRLRGAMVDACIKMPEQHFSLIRQMHVQKLKSDSRSDFKYLDGTPMRIGLAANFGTNRIETKDFLKNLNLNFRPIDVKGLMSFGATFTINEGNSRTKFEGAMASSGIDLEVSQWEMQMTALEYTHCLAIVPNQKETAWVSTLKGKERKGIYLCEAPVTNHPELFTERFFHIYPSATNAPVLDLLNPKNQPVNMVLRGQRDYYAFLRAIQKYIRPNHDAAKTVSQELREATTLYRGSSPVIPTVLSYPIVLRGPEINKRNESLNNPTFWDRFFLRYSENFD